MTQIAKSVALSCSKTLPQGGLLNVLDANAEAFVTAAGITDATQISAVNQFVKDLKAINTTLPNFVNFDTPSDSILKAAYPFIGGFATTHKWNLINPTDSDAAYRGHFVGTVTHSVNGIQGNGTNGAMDTHLNIRTIMGVASGGLDIFVQNDPNTLATRNDIGCFGYENPNYYRFAISAFTGRLRMANYHKEVATVGSSAPLITTSNGISNLNQLSDAIGGVKAYRNSILAATSSTAAALLWPNVTAYVGGANGPGASFSDNIISYAGIRSEGVSEAVLFAYNTAIVALQKNLGRLSLKNIFAEGHSMMLTDGASTSRLDYMYCTGINTSAFANRIFENYNHAIYGSTIAQMVARYATGVKLKARTGFKNIMPLWNGVNDIAGGAYTNNMAGLWAVMRAYIVTAISDGFIPIVITTTKATGVTDQEEIDRIAWNNLIMTDCPTGAIPLDITTHAEFNDPSNMTYFVDGLHMTVAGRQIVANDLIALINTI